MKRKQVWIYLSVLVAMWCGFDFLRIFLTFAGNMTIGIAIIGIIEIAAIAAVLYKIGCFGEKRIVIGITSAAVIITISLTFFALCSSSDLRLPIGLFLFGFLTAPFEWGIKLIGSEISSSLTAVIFSVPFVVLWVATFAGCKKDKSSS